MPFASNSQGISCGTAGTACMSAFSSPRPPLPQLCKHHVNRARHACFNAAVSRLGQSTRRWTHSIQAIKRNGYNSSSSSRLPSSRKQPDPVKPDEAGSNSWVSQKMTALLEPTIRRIANKFNLSFTSVDDLYGQILYNYYNWRQDTGNDLVLFVAFNVLLMLFGGTVKHVFVDGGREHFWLDLYEVITLTFGQEFPSIDDTAAQQVFSVFVAAFGLAAFALVLALVEQLVMEVLEENVKRGSQVYEEGHILILGWCESRRDLEMVGKIIDQLCLAYRTVGGTTVVVLTAKEKLEMESIFKRTLPSEQRFGTKLVFRQGSPLVPLDLKMVGASQAAVTIIVSDQSRSPDEADAQSLRCAILMSELTRDAGSSGSSSAKGDDSGDGVVTTVPSSFIASEITDISPEPELEEVLDLPPAARPFTQVSKVVAARNGVSNSNGRSSNGSNGNGTNDARNGNGNGSNGNGTKDVRNGNSHGLSSVASASQEDFSFFRGWSPFSSGGENKSSGASSTNAVSNRRGTPNGNGVSNQNGASNGSGVFHQNGASNGNGNGVSNQNGTSNGSGVFHQNGASNGNGNGVSNQNGSSNGNGLAVNGASNANGLSNVNGASNGVGLSNGNGATNGNGSSNGIGVSNVAAFFTTDTSMMDSMDSGSLSSRDDGPLSSIDAGVSSDSLGSYDGAWASVTQARMVVVEMKTMNMTPLVRYACNPNTVVPVPTGQINARRLATMVKTPHIAVITQQLFSFENKSQIYMQYFPQLIGTRFGDAVFRFPEGTVFGVCNSKIKRVVINPKANYIIRENDQLIIVRPTNVAPDEYHPLDEPVRVLLGDWQPYMTPSPALATKRDAAAKMGAYSGRNAAISFAAGPLGGMDLSFAASMSLLSSTVDESDEELSSKLPPQYQEKKNWELVPAQYWVSDTKPVKVLICGWAELSFMLDLVQEMDTGQTRLPPSSVLVFANTHTSAATVDKLTQLHPLHYIKVVHVQVDPLHRSTLASVLDIPSFNSALVLCDQRWIDADMDNTNGYDKLEANDMLRLDSLIMTVQLNIRKILDEQKKPAINIICQKVATEGLTMFEDRNRLPLGISVNLTSFAAKIITNVAYNPLLLLPISKLYDDVQLTHVDASEYARLGEALSFWEVMRRAQEKEHILLGWYSIPKSVKTVLKTVINPMGMEVRSEKRVWNNQSGNLRFIIYRNKEKSSHPESLRSTNEEDFYINSDPATWVMLDADPTLNPVPAVPKPASNTAKNGAKK